MALFDSIGFHIVLKKRSDRYISASVQIYLELKSKGAILLIFYGMAVMTSCSLESWQVFNEDISYFWVLLC